MVLIQSQLLYNRNIPMGGAEDCIIVVLLDFLLARIAAMISMAPPEALASFLKIDQEPFKECILLLYVPLKQVQIYPL